MKVPYPFIPTLEQLEIAYDDLQHEKLRKHEMLATYALWTRVDPRLGQILARYIEKHWEDIDPLKLRKAALQVGAGACLGVILEFVNDDTSFFAAWKNLITIDLLKANDELYFLGLSKIGGSRMIQESIFPSEQYVKWGFLGRESFSPHAKKPKFSRKTRLEILKQLFKSSPRIRIGDYLNAIEHCVSRRQAERDLLQMKPIKKSRKPRARLGVVEVK